MKPEGASGFVKTPVMGKAAAVSLPGAIVITSEQTPRGSRVSSPEVGLNSV